MMRFGFLRYILASKGTHSSRIWVRLARARNPAVRRRIAENEHCPSFLLSELGSDKHIDVRIAVALNPQTSPEMLKKLSRDRSPDVKHAIASTAYVPEDILKELRRDSNPYVATRARRTLLRIAKVKPMMEVC